MQSALKFITCGSVDDGKSTLIGRLLLDGSSVMRDQLESVSRSGMADLALLTDGLSAEREQGITIDVAWRYFATPRRKFIIGDSPGHEQYTRNMVTAASSADCAIVLVDATKLAWQNQPVALLTQTRRHALLCHLLRVRHVVFAANKLDALGQDAQAAYQHIHAAVMALAQECGFEPAAVLPVSGLTGHNVLNPHGPWGWYTGPALLPLLEQLSLTKPNTAGSPDSPIESANPSSNASMAVQWVEKTASSTATTAHARRVLWGRVQGGSLRVGDTLNLVNGSPRPVRVAKLLASVRTPVSEVLSGHSAGVILDTELDVSRGDWLLAQTCPNTTTLQATLSWLDDEPLVCGRAYWILHGHRWVKAKVSRVRQRLDIQTFESENAMQLRANDIGDVDISLSAPLPSRPYNESRSMGAFILVDPASNKTAAAGLIRAPE